jgi:hypothetical protein
VDYALVQYKWLGYLWYQHKWDEGKKKISAYAIADGFNADTALHLNKTCFRYTLGPSFNGKFGKLTNISALFGQLGTNSANKPVLAWMLTTYFEYNIKQKTNIGLGIDYLSGNNYGDSDNVHANTFSTLYATNHKYYGDMDVFNNIPKDTKNGGLTDIYLKISHTFKDKYTLGADIHNYMLSGKLRKAGGGFLNKQLGTEADLWFTAKPYEFVEIKAGYSYLMSTSSMEAISANPTASKNANASWAFLQLNVTPSFTFKKKD